MEQPIILINDNYMKVISEVCLYETTKQFREKTYDKNHIGDDDCLCMLIVFMQYNRKDQWVPLYLYKRKTYYR